MLPAVICCFTLLYHATGCSLASQPHQCDRIIFICHLSDVEIKPLGSAVKNHDQTESAFWHRNAIWWSLTSHWHWSTDPIETIDAIQQNAAKSHMEYIKEMGESYSGGYAGYIHHGNSIGADLELYYGGNAERIAEVKKHRDPSNLFRLYSPNSDSNAPFQVYTLT